MKKKWIVLIVLACIALAGYLYLRIRKTDDFEPQIKAKLSEMVSAASNGLYKLDMAHIEVDVTSGSVIAQNIFLLPDSARMLELEKTEQLPADIFSVHLQTRTCMALLCIQTMVPQSRSFRPFSDFPETSCRILLYPNSSASRFLYCVSSSPKISSPSLPARSDCGRWTRG